MNSNRIKCGISKLTVFEIALIQSLGKLKEKNIDEEIILKAIRIMQKKEPKIIRNMENNQNRIFHFDKSIYSYIHKYKTGFTHTHIVKQMAREMQSFREFSSLR